MDREPGGPRHCCGLLGNLGVLDTAVVCWGTWRDTGLDCLGTRRDTGLDCLGTWRDTGLDCLGTWRDDVVYDVSESTISSNNIKTPRLWEYEGTHRIATQSEHVVD